MTTLGQRIKAARKAVGKTQADVAEYVGVSSPAVTAWEGGGSAPTAANLVKLARYLGVHPNELLAYNDHEAEPNASEPVALPPISPRRIPVIGEAIGGDDGEFEMNGEIVDYVFCPPGYEEVPNLYAVYARGSSMHPIYAEGQTLWVHPSRPARKGDDVVVQVRGRDHERPRGFVKRFVSRSASTLTVEQFNPYKEIEFPVRDVVSVHKIIFAER